MPITGEIDVTDILAKLGDQTHGLRPATPEIAVEEREEIFRASYGQVDMSTSTSLATIPKVIWDVNSYYRSLDIGWPYKPTRRELRQGFQRVEGHASERLTYYMKQLLDPQVREEYDRMPLGSVFRDKYVLESEFRKLADLASHLSEDSGTLVTAGDLVDEYDRERPRPAPPLPPSGRWWNWGFFAHKSREHNTDPLESWQNLLIQAFSEQKVATTISIGYIGGTHCEFDIRKHQDRDVFFLNDKVTPTQELAKTAVSRYMAHNQKGNR